MRFSKTFLCHNQSLYERFLRFCKKLFSCEWNDKILLIKFCAEVLQFCKKRVTRIFRMETDNCKQYSLRWEKHAFNLASEAGCFFEDESFLDCTLSAEGQCIEAHKIILSAASSYLSNLLKIVPDKHPVLIFNDIKFEQLKSLVAFIYNGSVNVSENNIHAFLNAAQSLLIKGLSEESKEDEKYLENTKKPRNVEPLEFKQSRKPNGKSVATKKDDLYIKNIEETRNLKKQRQILPKVDGLPFAECEESLSKLQEISFTKYIHQNLSSKAHVRHEILENKWNGSSEEKQRVPENYVVKSWKHNSVEDLNGRHKQSKNNSLKKIKLEKPINSGNEGPDPKEKTKTFAESNEHSAGTHPSNAKSEEMEDNIKKDNLEQRELVEPKKELIEDEDTNSEDYGMLSAHNETAVSESDSLYESRSVPNYYPQTIVDRGVPVPLLMCRTSLSEPDSVEPGWIPPLGGNMSTDHSPAMNPLDGNVQDLQCRTCAQDLPCPTCTKKYKSRYALNRHILYECGKARKSFSCDECGKKVTRQDTLQKHKLIHLVQHLKKKECKSDDESSKRKKI